jgi:hypothetical protein
MKVSAEKDIVTGKFEGDAAGYLLPLELANVSVGHLRIVNGAVIDASANASWYLDERGTKHIVPGPGWQPITCGVDTTIVPADGGGWRAYTPSETLAPDIKRECSRRIVAVLKDATTRENMATWASELIAKVSIDGATLTPDEQADLETCRDARGGVRDMQSACRDLIDAADPDFRSDAKWPPAPAGAAELADQF